MEKMTKHSLTTIITFGFIFLWTADTGAILQEPQKLARAYEDLEKHFGSNAPKDEDLVLLTRRTTHPDAQWFPDAGLGLFMHFNLPSVHPRGGSSWSCFTRQANPGANSHSLQEFWDLADNWNPEKYEPDKWMKAAKAAGFKYAVLTAKTHVGYGLWPSQYGRMSTKQYMNSRDLLRPYVEACRKNGIKVGFYFSGFDWHFEREYINFFQSRGSLFSFDYFGRPEESSDRKDVLFLNYKHELVEKLPERPEGWAAQFAEFSRGQTFEILNNYGPIDLWWWDGGGDVTTEEIRKIQPSIVINNRAGGGDYVTPETFGQFDYDYIKYAREKGWWIELCEIWTHGSWHYDNQKENGQARGEQLNDTGWVLYLLALCRCWDSNLLLNVGPRPDGQMPRQFYEKCAEMAEWMKHSGESVSGITGGGPFPERSNVPITIRNNTWYFHPDYRRQTWDKPIVVQEVGKPVTVKLLRTGAPLNYSHVKGTLKILIPKDMRTDLTDVVAVQF
ncbi:alpha-L-fucosidase [Planctomycetota bacterium]